MTEILLPVLAPVAVLILFTILRRVRQRRLFMEHMQGYGLTYVGKIEGAPGMKLHTGKESFLFRFVRKPLGKAVRWFLD